jgi:hypothetical protein
MRKTILKLLRIGLGTTGFLLFVGLGIGGIDPMPGYAVVFLDDISKTYIALPCIEEWRSRPSNTIDLVRRGTASEAAGLKYDPDKNCRETGAFADAGRSLTGLLLVKLGILPPVRHWWDAPHRTEEGGVVWPGAEGQAPPGQ